MTKLKFHLFTLPRWFAAPFFGSSLILGSILAGGRFSDIYLWLGLVAGMLLMAGGHSFNSYLDYAWTGLDKGNVESRSAEKSYTGGQNLLARGLVTEIEVLINALSWYVAASFVLAFITITNVSPMVIVIGFLGMLVTFWYSKAKFNYTHEIALGVGVGPIGTLLGMYSVNVDPPWIIGLLVSVPFAIVLSFAGLALDEWPDAEANLKKGVKSIAYKVWEYKVDLGSYLMWWMLLLCIYQVLLITLEVLAPLTALSFITMPVLIALLVMLKGSFERWTPWFVIVAALYLILLVLGQALGD